MRQQNAARLLHDTRSTIYEDASSSWPGVSKCHGVTESVRRIADGVSVEWEIPRTTDHGCVNKSCPPSFRPVEEELMPRSRRGGSRGAGSPPPASPPRASRRSAPPPCSGFTGAPGHSRRTARGTSCRLVHQITKFNFLPARGASIAPSPSGCPFILGALSSSFHWRFLVPS